MKMLQRDHDRALIFRILFCFILCLMLFPRLVPASTPMEGLPAPPTGNAAAHLLMDADTGRILAASNIDTPLEPASLTKMMTVYVAGQQLKRGDIALSDMVRVGENAWRMKGSRMFLDLGSTVSVHDLLHGIIIQSGNDAAVALAEHIAGSEALFVELMNQAALDLGMDRTHFVNATGMPARGVRTTARDLAVLSAALIRKHPELYRLHAVKEFEHNNIKQYNRNRLLHRDDSVDGIKTGYTKGAGYCQATSARRDGTRLIAVVLGAETIASRTRLNQALLEYGFNHFETRKLYTRRQPLGSLRVWKARKPVLSYGVSNDVYVTVPKGQIDRLEHSISLALSEPILGPVPINQKIGTLQISLDQQVQVLEDLIALSDAEEADLVTQILDSIRLLFLRKNFL